MLLGFPLAYWIARFAGRLRNVLVSGFYTAFLDGDFSKTTGQIVNVDGGQAAAFLR